MGQNQSKEVGYVPREEDSQDEDYVSKQDFAQTFQNEDGDQAQSIFADADDLEEYSLNLNPTLVKPKFLHGQFSS